VPAEPAPFIQRIGSYLGRPHWLVVPASMWLAVPLVGLLRHPSGSLRGDHDYFGVDFVAVGAAARSLATQADRLYDPAQLATAASEWLGTQVVALPYLNPPLLAEAMRPVASLPFAVALPVWTAIGLAALMLAVRAMAPGAGWRQQVLFVAAFPPAAISVAVGQTTPITLLLTVLALRTASRRPLVAGMVAGLTIYRPHWCLPLVALLAVVSGSWRLAAAGAGSAAAICLLGVAMRPTAWTAFADFTRHVLPHLKERAGFEPGSGVGVRDFATVLLGNGRAADLTALGLLLGIWAWGLREVLAARAWPAQAFILGLFFLLLGSPHVAPYDWLLAGPGLLWLWTEHPHQRDRVITALALIALALLARPLSALQRAAAGHGIHLSTVLLGLATWVMAAGRPAVAPARAATGVATS
jgi:hypothetical protein